MTKIDTLRAAHQALETAQGTAAEIAARLGWPLEKTQSVLAQLCELGVAVGAVGPNLAAVVYRVRAGERSIGRALADVATAIRNAERGQRKEAA